MALFEEIAKFQKEMMPKIPQDVLQTMQKTSAEIISKNLHHGALKSGDTIPAFTLPDATGTPVSSDQLLKSGLLVISFYRGGWCPYCNLELKALQSALLKIKTLKANLIVISPELQDHARVTQEENSLEYPVLSDVGNSVAKQFGLVYELGEEMTELFKHTFNWDLQSINGAQKVELPFPATYVVDQGGIVKYAFVDADYTQRAEPDKIIEVLRSCGD